MNSAPRAPLPVPVGDIEPAAEALEFVRFCYQRRRIGWPELYDEMCAVAGRGLYQGWGVEELAAVGIGFSLFEMPRLAAMAARIVAEEGSAPRRATARGAESREPGRIAEPSGSGSAQGAADGRTAMRLVPRAV